MLSVRNYNPKTDYQSVEKLYRDSSIFGGQFDDARDSEERLRALITEKSDAILVAEENSEIIGTVTLFGDERSMWLYRFAVKENKTETAQALWDKAKEICKKLGHKQVLVYSPLGNNDLGTRYINLGFTKGGDFTAFWQNLN